MWTIQILNRKALTTLVLTRNRSSRISSKQRTKSTVGSRMSVLGFVLGCSPLILTALSRDSSTP